MAFRNWSGRRESNPRLLLGRQGHYHYATPANLGGGLTETGVRPAPDTVPANFAPYLGYPPSHASEAAGPCRKRASSKWRCALLCWWAGLDSNQRTALSGPGLQPGAFNHSTTYPRGRPPTVRAASNQVLPRAEGFHAVGWNMRGGPTWHSGDCAGIVSP